MKDKEGNKYPEGPLRPSEIYLESLKGWPSALKLAFFPFLIAVLCDVALALSARHLHTETAVYGLKVLASLIALFCVLFSFYLVHTDWMGDKSGWKKRLGVCSKRFFPALVSFVIIFSGALLLMAVGFVLMRMLRPYAHLLGQVAAPILISVVGLLSVIWVVACFYWPFYMVRDADRFGFAIKKSYAIAGLTKSVMVYMPAIAFILIFLLTNQRMPWMNFSHSVWVDIAIGFAIKWVLGAWALTVMCLMMNQSDFMLAKIEADMAKKGREKAEKKAQKKTKKDD